MQWKYKADKSFHIRAVLQVWSVEEYLKKNHNIIRQNVTSLRLRACVCLYSFTGESPSEYPALQHTSYKQYYNNNQWVAVLARYVAWIWIRQDARRETRVGQGKSRLQATPAVGVARLV